MSAATKYIHVGYVLTLTEEVKTQLTPYLGPAMDCLFPEPRHAVLFKEGWNLEAWFTKREAAPPPIGQIRGLYVKNTRKERTALALLYVDGLQEYVTLGTNSDGRPIDLKRRANRGELGPMISVAPHILVTCTPYAAKPT